MNDKITRRNIITGGIGATMLGSVGLLYNNDKVYAAKAVANVVTGEQFGSVPAMPWTQGALLTRNNKGEDLFLTIPMSLNGRLNVVKIGSAPYKNTSQNIFNKDLFNDNKERVLQSGVPLPDGNVVLGTSIGDVIIYNPNTNVATVVNNMPKNVNTMTQSINFCEGKVIVGTRSGSYPNGEGHVLVGNYDNGVITSWQDLGTVGDGTVMGIASWNGTYFVGTGHAKGLLRQLNPDGSWTTIDQPTTIKSSNVNEDMSNVQVYNDYLVAAYNGANVDKRWKVSIYKLSKNSSGKTIATYLKSINAGWSFAVGKTSTELLYRGDNHAPFSFDISNPINNNPVRISNVSIDQPMNVNTILNDGNIIAPGSNGDFRVLDMNDKKTIYNVNFNDGPNNTELVSSGKRTVQTIIKTEDNKTILSQPSYFSLAVGTWSNGNTARKDIKISTNNIAVQVQHMSSVNGWIVMSSYPYGGNFAQMRPDGSGLTSFDTQFNGPVKRLDGLLRPGAMANIGGGVAAIGVYGNIGHPTGGLYLWDTAKAYITKSTYVPFDGHGISCLTDRPVNTTNGWVYGVTNTRMPDNPWDDTKFAVVFRWHPGSNKFESIPIPERMLNDLQFATDGKLYGIGGNRLYCFSTGLSGTKFAELIKERTTIGSQSSAWAGGITPLKNGNLIISAGGGTGYHGELWLYDPSTKTRVDLKTLGGKVIVDDVNKQWYYNYYGDIKRQYHPEASTTYTFPDNYNVSRQLLKV